MQPSHYAALSAKHDGLERQLRDEMNRPVPDVAVVQAIKKQKLKIKEEMTLN